MYTKLRLVLLSVAVAALSACGGGGGGASVISSSSLTGTAATGAALANAGVSITDGAGNSPCVEVSITTTALGSYTCTLKAGETAPFFIVVTDPTGNTAPLVSIATDTPAAGTPLTVNATPLTTAIVAQLNNGDALGLVTSHTVNTANLLAVKANVIAQLKAVYDSIKTTSDPANYDPFTTSITAATASQTGNTADLVLDVVKITTTSTGVLALSTISDPTPVVLATASTAGDPILAPTTSVADLSMGAQLAAQAFNSCFALPASQRVTLDSSQNIVSVANECQNITTNGTVPAGAPAFKQNGRAANWVFYSYLTADSMTGAKFSVPEIMAFYPIDASHTRERAVMNIKWIDNLGIANNIILLAQNFPETINTLRLSGWWITGNQHDYDIQITAEIRRVQELNSLYANSSRYQNGLQININGVNNATAVSLNRAAAPNSELYDSVWVTGPGLPTTGIWFVRESTQTQLAIFLQRSASPIASFPTNLICHSCVTFKMSRTLGLTGTDVATYRTNPSSLDWAQATDGSYTGASGTRPTKGAVYTFAIYNAGTLVATETRTLLTDLVAAVQGINMQWNAIGSNTAVALDPLNTTLNGAVTSLPIDWVQNPAAETVRYLWVSMANGVYDNATKLTWGATSVVATPFTGTTFTDLTLPASAQNGPTIFGGYREVGFQYRMLDGSRKNAVYHYYK